jgi:hypothetical protein
MRARRAIVTLTMAGAVAAATTMGAMAQPLTADTTSTSTADALAKAAAIYAASPVDPGAPADARTTATLDAGLKPANGATRQLNWKIGFAKQSLDPTQAMLKAGFHLGGFGLGPTRASTGPAVNGKGVAEHIYARAMAISNLQGQTLMLAALENQGTFAAYKEGPYGLWDIRQQVSKDTGVPVDMIVINSDHSHGGPDMIGLWGGVPVDYMQEVFAQTVKALDQAYAHRALAELRVGSNKPVVPAPGVGRYLAGTASPGEDFVHSQFGKNVGANGIPATNYDDSLVDTQLRVLQAVGADGKRLGTLINYAAHATVMGSSNLGYSADWPGRVAHALEQRAGEPVAVTMVADVGRSQPPRPHSDPKCDQPNHPSCEADKLDTWTSIFLPWVIDAVAHSVPVNGTQVSGQEVFTREVATNPALLGVSYSGEGPARGTGAYRAMTAPWVTGDVIGTFASAHRLGDVLLTASPGEAYPDIRFGVQNEIKAPQAFFTFGLANDQLGYLIAPASEYGWISYSNVGNDNSFFNVSAQYGDHLYCTQKAAALALGFLPTNEPQPYGPYAQQPVCPALAASDVVPAGPILQQPWLFGDGVTPPAGT